MQITIKGAVHVTDVLVNSALLTQMLSKEQFTCEIVSNTESKVLADDTIIIITISLVLLVTWKCTML